MKLITFINKLKDLDHPQVLDKDYIGSCPCFGVTRTIEGKKVHIMGRCWRVSDNEQDLYVWGELPLKDLKAIGLALKKNLDAQQWYNEYTLILTEP